MATRAPTSALSQTQRVVGLRARPDVDLPPRPVLGLRMAFETEIEIAFDQQLTVH